MKVLMLTTDLRLGGVERTILNRIECLRRWGVQCAVAGLTEGRGRPPRLREALEKLSVPVFSARMARPCQVWHLGGLRRQVRTWGPDLIHAHMFHAHAASLAVAGEVPLVWSHHSARSTPARDLFYRLFSGRPAAHVYVSEAARAVRARDCARTDALQEVIPNGIDLRPFEAVEPQAGHVVGAMGRLVPEKGFDVLLKAFALLTKRRPEARLRIAGEGPERGTLERLARQLGLEGRVAFVGFVEDVAGFLSSVNVLAVPSRWESFGNVLVEGLAAGLPCVASRVGGLIEVGGDLVTWVEPGDAGALAGAIEGLLDAPVRSQEVERRRLWARVKFSRERMARDYFELYMRVLDRVRGAGADA